MQIPKEARRQARELFDSSLDHSGRPDREKVLRIADLLLKSAPRHTLQILREFARLVRLESARHHAVIESAVEIDAASRGAIEASLRRIDGGDITVETRVDPALVGGSRILLGSEVWDASVRSRLAALS